MSKLTAESLVKSLLISDEKGDPRKIAAATGGEAVSASFITKVAGIMTEKLVTPVAEDKAKAGAAQRRIATIASYLKASTELRSIIAAADDLFPKDGPARAKGKATALSTGVKAFLEGSNDYRAKMAEAVPLLADDAAKAKRLSALRNAAQALTDALAKEGCKDASVKVHAVIALIQ